MKWVSGLLLAIITLFSPRAYAAQTAQARMYCLSVRFQHGNDQNGLYSLDMSTLSAGNNGELPPDWIGVGWQTPTGYSNSTWVTLKDLIFDDEYPGVLALNLPPATDANNNGTPDFFEVSRSVNASTMGLYNISGFGSGTASAQWYRDAASAFGGCDLRLRINQFQTLNFFLTFEILEYTGPLSYTPAATNVIGTVDLVQTSNTTYTMQGPVRFTKTSTNKFNALVFPTTFWTNQWGTDLSISNYFGNGLYSRDLVRLTNYSGFVEFWDYDPGTFDPDYWWWRMVISDTNDTDHDGIPDFSDDPSAGGLPRRPSLSLFRTTTNLLLTISGDVGRLHTVQEKTALDSGNWSDVLSVTLSTDPQTVALPAPSGAAKFWRVQAQ